MSCNHRYLQSGRVMDRAVPAAWCRLPGCLFAAGKELGKSHLSWSTGKRHRWGISPGRISIGKPSSLLLVIRDELMTLHPLHLPPRMKLKSGGISRSIIKKQNKPETTLQYQRWKQHQTNPFRDLASARQELLPAPFQDGIGAAPAPLFLLLRNSSGFLFGACTHQMVHRGCLETSASPPGCLGCWAGLPVVTGAFGRLRLNKWLLLMEQQCQGLDWQAGAFSKVQMRRGCPQLSP